MPTAGLPVASTITSMSPAVAFVVSAVNVVEEAMKIHGGNQSCLSSFLGAPPNSGLPEFGYVICPSRQQPTWMAQARNRFDDMLGGEMDSWLNAARCPGMTDDDMQARNASTPPLGDAHAPTAAARRRPRSRSA